MYRVLRNRHHLLFFDPTVERHRSILRSVQKIPKFVKCFEIGAIPTFDAIPTFGLKNRPCFYVKKSNRFLLNQLRSKFDGADYF